MKRKITIITILIIILTGFCVFAVSSIVDNLSNASDVIIPELSVKQSFVMKELEKAKKSGESVQNQVEYYAYFVSVLQPTEEEKEYIDGLIKDGYDAEALVKIFDFWRYTSEDMNIIEKAYESRPYDLDVSYWVDEAFIQLHKDGSAVTEYGNLSVEEVKAYLAEGIKPEEIRAADKLSRKGVKSTEKILEEKKNGSSWYNIADEIYGIQSDETDLAEFSVIDNLNEIIESVKLAVRTNRSVKDVLREVAKGESSTKKNKDFKTEKMKDAKESLKKQKLWNDSVKKEKKKAIFGEEELF